ncbi:hypothetical protein SDC9_199788 [bioreactor metagenome]|uniref:Uncharacterized protein n=1 Tax=bioreactor metagenome TaxID=1076179 RepID=A0A645IUR5_9ZZZZ
MAENTGLALEECLFLAMRAMPLMAYVLVVNLYVIVLCRWLVSVSSTISETIQFWIHVSFKWHSDAYANFQAVWTHQKLNLILMAA